MNAIATLTETVAETAIMINTKVLKSILRLLNTVRARRSHFPVLTAVRFAGPYVEATDLEQSIS